MRMQHETMVRRAHKPVKSHKQWTQHDCDMDSFHHGKRHAKRGNARQLWRGMSASIAERFTADQFIRGKGLTRKPNTYEVFVNGVRRGFTQDINYGLAYATAAKQHGLDAMCREA